MIAPLFWLSTSVGIVHTKYTLGSIAEWLLKTHVSRAVLDLQLTSIDFSKIMLNSDHTLTQAIASSAGNRILGETGTYVARETLHHAEELGEWVDQYMT